jgi:hypothetical protein
MKYEKENYFGFSGRRVRSAGASRLRVGGAAEEAGLAEVYADSAWDSTQATVVFRGRRRHGVSWRVGLDIAKIVGSPHPLVAFADEVLNEAAEIISSYVHSRYQW